MIIVYLSEVAALLGQEKKFTSVEDAVAKVMTRHTADVLKVTREDLSKIRSIRVIPVLHEHEDEVDNNDDIDAIDDDDDDDDNDNDAVDETIKGTSSADVVNEEKEDNYSEADLMEPPPPKLFSQHISPVVTLCGKVAVSKSGRAVILRRHRRGKRWDRLFDADETRLRAMAFLANCKRGVYIETSDDRSPYVLDVDCSVPFDCSQLISMIHNHIRLSGTAATSEHTPATATAATATTTHLGKRGRWVFLPCK